MVLVATAIAIGVALLILVVPFGRMPDVSNTPWHELARGVALGDEGAHESNDPYFILGTTEDPSSAVAALRRRLTSQGWRVFQDPNPFGGVTFDRADDPGRAIFFEPFPGQTLEDLADYSMSPERLRELQRQNPHVYILEMFFP